MAQPKRSQLTIRLVVVALWLALVIPGGIQLAAHRNYKETIVLGPGVTEVRKLSDWAPYIEGTTNDCNIYVLTPACPAARCW